MKLSYWEDISIQLEADSYLNKNTYNSAKVVEWSDGMAHALPGKLKFPYIISFCCWKNDLIQPKTSPVNVLTWVFHQANVNIDLQTTFEDTVVEVQ